VRRDTVVACRELLVGNESDDTVWRLSLDDDASSAGRERAGAARDRRRARSRHALVTDYGHAGAGRSLTVPKICSATLGISVRSTEMEATPPADLGTRVDRYRCCLPALAGFST